MLTLMWLWIKTNFQKVVLPVVAAALVLFGVKFAKDAGENQERLKQLEDKQKRDEATRERAREADEKIRDPNYVDEWLHRNNRFRD